MHKYSYELSASYRKEIYLPKPYFRPQKVEPFRPVPTYMNSSFNPTARQHSKTFVLEKKDNIVSDLQSQREFHQSHTKFRQANRQQQQRYKETDGRYSEWKPNTAKGIQSRLKILSHLGQRHQQAIRQLDQSHLTASPIRQFKQETQREVLNRDFSFMKIPLDPPSQQKWTEIDIRHKIRAEPLSDKHNLINMEIPRTAKDERAELMIRTDKGRNIYNNTIHTIENPPCLKVNKAITKQTMAKLSSLQDRIRSTVQAYPLK